MSRFLYKFFSYKLYRIVGGCLSKSLCYFIAHEHYAADSWIVLRRMPLKTGVNISSPFYRGGRKIDKFCMEGDVKAEISGLILLTSTDYCNIADFGCAIEPCPSKTDRKVELPLWRSFINGFFRGRKADGNKNTRSNLYRFGSGFLFNEMERLVLAPDHPVSLSHFPSLSAVLFNSSSLSLLLILFASFRLNRKKQNQIIMKITHEDINCKTVRISLSG